MANSTKLHFVVPKGFRGMFVVVEDKEADPISSTQGAWVLKIPSDGQLRTSSTELFCQWHTATSSFSDGTTLPVKTSTAVSPFKDGKTELRYLDTDSNGRASFFVGTESEYAEALKMRLHLPLGRIEATLPGGFSSHE
jgi:hypothetical protein